jgi:hypothetical protein
MLFCHVHLTVLEGGHANMSTPRECARKNVALWFLERTVHGDRRTMDELCILAA